MFANGTSHRSKLEEPRLFICKQRFITLEMVRSLTDRAQPQPVSRAKELSSVTDESTIVRTGAASAVGLQRSVRPHVLLATHKSTEAKLSAHEMPLLN